MWESRAAFSAIVLFFAPPVTSLHAGDFAVTAIISSSPAPPGGTAQITFALPSALALVTGDLSLDLDPVLFDTISAVNVFGASGDQVGTATIQGHHAEVRFTSASGGVGRLPSYPVLEVTVPVLGTAKLMATGGIFATSKTPWRDILGNRYTMSFESRGIFIAHGLSIQNVVPGGGPLPEGTLVQINGQGFTASTKLQLDNVAWSNLQFVNSRQLTFTLSGPADLTGKLVVLIGENQARSRYYSALTPTSVRRAASVPASVQPIFSELTYADTDTAGSYQWLALENAALSPVDVLLRSDSLPIGRKPPPPPNTAKITIPPGGVYILDSADMPPGNYFSILPSSPLRKVLLCCSSTREFTAFLPVPGTHRSQANFSETYFYVSDGNGANIDGPISFNWRPGDPPPPPIFLYVADSGKVPLNVTAKTDDDGDWLSASFPTGTAKLTVWVDPVGLSLGSHKGILAVAQPGTTAPLVQFTVILTVDRDPAIVAIPAPVYIESFLTGALTIASTAGSVPIKAISDTWLSVAPADATTPAHLSVSVTNPSLVAGQAGGKWGTITVEGPRNSLQIPVYVSFDPIGIVEPIQLTLFAESGSNVPVRRRIDVGPTLQPISFESATESGGQWLSAAMSMGLGVPGLAVSVDPSSLPSGEYHGIVTIHPASGSLHGPISISVTAFIWAKPTPAPQVFPSSLEFTIPATVRGFQTLSLSTGLRPLEFSVESQTDDDSVNFLGADGPPVDFSARRYTPNGIMVQTYVGFPGVYRGHLAIASPPGSSNPVIVPVTLRATPAPPLAGAPPLIASIVNGASLLPGPVAPGEMLTLFGVFGPNATSGVNVGHDGKLNGSSYGNRILFNGKPAPLTYISPTQINAIVPYEISGSSTAIVELDMAGILSPAWSVPVVLSAPGLFTQSGSGQGIGAVLNQDNSLKASTTPAARGSIVQLFATGEGQTNPGGITGEVTHSDVKRPLLPVSVTIGGVDAKVISATTAPDSVAGLFQINAQIPSDLPPGATSVGDYG